MGTEGYNERLFDKGGLRRWYHLARYHWAQQKLAALVQGDVRMIELGCFDGKLIDFVPQPLIRYVGIDANWEDGLDIARARFGRLQNVELIEGRDASVLSSYADGEFNVAVALETLEHLPIGVLKEYLRQLARVTSGWLLISVPNEMGPVFVAKYLAKKLKYGSADPYTMSEFIAAATWQASKVKRDEHKGFDYRELVDELSELFDVTGVEGVPYIGLPPALSLTIGITARSRDVSAS